MACIEHTDVFMLAQSSPINSASSRSSSSVSSPAGAFPVGSGTGAMTTGSAEPAGFLGVEVASSDQVQCDWVIHHRYHTYH